MDGGPAVNEILGDAELVSCLVDDSADIDWPWDDLSSVLGAVSSNFVPGGFGGHLDAFLELLWGVDVGVIDPFFILDVVMVGSD